MKIEPRHLKRWLPIAALLLAALGVNLERFGIDLEQLAGGGQTSSRQDSGSRGLSDGGSVDAAGLASEEPDYRQWSDTSPEVNLWHVFEGEINRSGKPVGFHSRPGGVDPDGARVLEVRDRPNGDGVYTANVQIRDGNQTGTKFSSFFPDSLSRDEVMDAILNAYRNSRNPDAQPFSGPSGLGFQIQGYTSSRGGINTAYPIYVR